MRLPPQETPKRLDIIHATVYNTYHLAEPPLEIANQASRFITMYDDALRFTHLLHRRVIE